VNSTLNCTRKPRSDSCDIGFRVQFHVEFPRQVMNFPIVVYCYTKTVERECVHRLRKQCFRAHNFSTQSAKNVCNPLAMASIVTYSTSPPSQIRTRSIKNQPLGLVFTNILVFLDSRNRQESN